jgi:HEAT repeat protein
MGNSDVSPVLIKGFKHPNKEVRKKALGSLFAYSPETSIKVLQPTVALLSDIDPEVRKAALNRIGDFAERSKDSPELASLLKEKVLPVLIKMLRGKHGETVCYTAFTIGDFGADGEAAIPALVRMMKQKATYPNNCAVDALFKLGEKGRKFLSKEKIESRQESEKWDRESFDNYKKDRAKPIEPKPAPAVKKVPDTY